MAGLSLSLLLVVGAVVWVGLRDDPYVAPGPGRPPPSAAPALAAQTLLELEEAVQAGDPAAAEKLAPTGDEAARERLGAIVENAQALRVRDFTLRYVTEESAVSGDGEWDAAVDTTWRFAGFDQAVAGSEVRFRFKAEDGRVALLAIGGGGRVSPVWLSERVAVRRTATTLVLAAGDPALADALARRARRAITAVRQVLPGWPGGLVVEAPATATGLHQALGAEPDTYAVIAAVTAGADGSSDRKSSLHVFVNPRVYAAEQPVGKQLVMSHEAVHVATSAGASAVPPWLLEGFADYVALRDVDLPVSTTAGRIIREVRRHGPPRALPGPDEFDTAAPHLGAAYEGAWQACLAIVDLAGEAALVELYRRVDDGQEIGAALRAAVGVSLAELTRRWQARLTDLAA